MVPRSQLVTALAVVFVFLGVCAARSVPSRRDSQAVSLSSFDNALGTVELWRRRVHDSGSDSSSDSDSTSSSSTSSTSSDSDNDDDGKDTSSSSSSTSDRCIKAKNVTRVIQNDDGYGSYYSSGIGSEDSTAGGSTPDGSGTAPRFDNSTQAFVVLADNDAANEVEKDSQHYLSYLGGAAVPFKSGDDSPNGVAPKHLEDLSFPSVDDEDDVKDGSCAVPNNSYAYPYDAKYSLGSAGNVPVYCLCDPYGLCGCDDHHTNSSFVDAMLSYAGLSNEAKNVSSVCTVTLEGETTILINGGLSNGSTKADPDADAVLAREPRTKTRKCGGGTGAAAGVSVNGFMLGAVAFGLSVLFV
ncbi:hypothetical protein BDV18DRAFT_163056 [Aspergillus unguis]